MTDTISVSRDFASPADIDTLDTVADALRGKGYEVEVVDDLDAARRAVLARLPEGTEVGSGSSETLAASGITEAVEMSGRFDAIRPRLRTMDRATQMRDIRKLGTAPDVWLTSAHAVTTDGVLVIASASGSQLGPIASGPVESCSSSARRRSCRTWRPPCDASRSTACPSRTPGRERPMGWAARSTSC